jgi:hypothetical protein
MEIGMMKITHTMSALAFAAVVASAGLAAPASAAARTPQVGIGLQTKEVSPAALKSQIRAQATKLGLKLTDEEVETAVNGASNKLQGVGPGPQKGIIHLKFKRFTICISWGPDKGYCKSRGG